MKLFGISAIASALMLVALPASAQVGGPSNDTFKAEFLQSTCNPPAGTDQATRESAAVICEFYFRGLTDGLFLLKTSLDKGDAGCLPTVSPISTAEARGDFELFLRDHPEAAQNSAAIVAFFGVMRAHPCPK